MPNPSDYDKKDKQKYMEDCMHQTRKVEKKPQGESVAICLSRWREDKGEDKKSKSAHSILRGIAERILAND
jgi:hypothetical protein